MKRIMFKDKFLLTQAVLEGRKTETRRFIDLDVWDKVTLEQVVVDDIFQALRSTDWMFMSRGKWYQFPRSARPQYKKGEVLAIAQRYEDVCNDESLKHSAGWHNKLFVKPSLMPNKIQIFDLHADRLQNISDESCFAEGVESYRLMYKDTSIGKKVCMNCYYVRGIRPHGDEMCFYNSDIYPEEVKLFRTPREAYAALIDKLYGQGTWDKNPWVWVYQFGRI